MEIDDRKAKYQLVSVNRWSIENHTKTVHRLLSIGTATSNRPHARYLYPVFSKDRIYPVVRVVGLYWNQPLARHYYTFPCHCKPSRTALHISFLLATIGTFMYFLLCMWSLFWSTIKFVIFDLDIVVLFIILQSLLLLLLAISLFAKEKLLLPEFFCGGTMQPLPVFWSLYCSIKEFS